MQHPITKVGDHPVQRVLTIDGTKLVLENDQWVLLRFSGTEPLLRIFAEADSPEQAEALLREAQALLPM